MDWHRLSFLLPKNPIQILAKHLAGHEATILDLGFGEGMHWAALNPKIFSELNVTGLDAHPSDHPTLAKKIIKGRVPHDLVNMPSDSFDHVIAFDVIEHLSKSEGYLMLYEMERIAKHSAWIFTTNGHVWQPPAEGNLHQAHISGWTPRDLRRFGWKQQYGCRGLRFFYGPLAQPKFSEPRLLAGAIRVIPDLAATKFPAASFSFLAGYIKDASARRQRDALEIHRTN